MPLPCSEEDNNSLAFVQSQVLGGSRTRTICPDTTVFSRDELQMRKKAEVLQYNNNFSFGTAGVVPTRKHKYAQIMKPSRAGRRTYSSQTSKGTNPNIKGLSIVSNTLAGRPRDGLICSIKGLTTSVGYKAGIRGDSGTLSYNPTIPPLAFTHNTFQSVPQF